MEYQKIGSGTSKDFFVLTEIRSQVLLLDVPKLKYIGEKKFLKTCFASQLFMASVFEFVYVITAVIFI